MGFSTDRPSRGDERETREGRNAQSTRTTRVAGTVVPSLGNYLAQRTEHSSRAAAAAGKLRSRASNKRSNRCGAGGSSEARPLLVLATIKLGVQESCIGKAPDPCFPRPPSKRAANQRGPFRSLGGQHPHPLRVPGRLLAAPECSPRVKRAPPRVICRLFVIPPRPPARQACRARERWRSGFKLVVVLLISLGETGPMEPRAASFLGWLLPAPLASSMESSSEQPQAASKRRRRMDGWLRAGGLFSLQPPTIGE